MDSAATLSPTDVVLSAYAKKLVTADLLQAVDKRGICAVPAGYCVATSNDNNGIIYVVGTTANHAHASAQAVMEDVVANTLVRQIMQLKHKDFTSTVELLTSAIGEFDELFKATAVPFLEERGIKCTQTPAPLYWDVTNHSNILVSSLTLVFTSSGNK